jgi:hypothetical protein
MYTNAKVFAASGASALFASFVSARFVDAKAALAGVTFALSRIEGDRGSKSDAMECLDRAPSAHLLPPNGTSFGDENRATSCIDSALHDSRQWRKLVCTSRRIGVRARVVWRLMEDQQGDFAMWSNLLDSEYVKSLSSEHGSRTESGLLPVIS